MIFKDFSQPLDHPRSIVAVWIFVSMGRFNFESFYLKIHPSATRRCPCAVFWLLSGVLAFLFLAGELHNNAIIVAVSTESLLLITLLAFALPNKGGCCVCVQRVLNSCNG